MYDIKEIKLDFILNKTYKFIRFKIFTTNVFIISGIIALILANSTYKNYYFEFIHFNIGIKIGEILFENSVIHWVNDALMAIFFLYVGLEIKREFFIGELSRFDKAILPIIAALGGMIVPAFIYFVINLGNDINLKGTGIPIATDIAFSLGVLSLLRKRIPISLKVFLTAFAIIDDIGAVTVIAIFYSTNFCPAYLIPAGLVLMIMLFFNRLRIIHPIPYTLLGILLWVLIYRSGIHATIAGLLCAFTVPVKGKIDINFFATALNFLSNQVIKKRKKILSLDVLAIGKSLTPEVQSIELTSKWFTPPLLRLENLLQPWVNYVILPFFAFVNCGIDFSSITFNNVINTPILYGIILGLVLGKPIGIYSASYLAVKYKICSLPRGTNWGMMLGASILGGIGFTMSLFISNLSFENPFLLDVSKIGIFAGSLISGLIGLIILKKNVNLFRHQMVLSKVD